jgi:peptidoglycan hydrolase CwlO-like protein
MYIKRNDDIVYELEKTEQKNQEEITSLEGQLNDLQEKQDLFTRKNKDFISVNERLTSDIRLKEMSFEKL